MNKTDLCYTPAARMAEAIRTKALSPVEIAEACLERIEEINPKINAYCTLAPETTLAEARAAEQAVMDGKPLGPLHGVPYSVKDLLYTKGLKTMRGSEIFREYVPEVDAVAVERMRAAGGVILGKTTTPELGWKGVTDSPVTGITRNPWNLERTPGGSSGGASAQVAAGLGPLALGTDGGGSIRIPAGFAGIFGLKPTSGRVPVYPASIFNTLSHVGPMTRTVEDAALMLSVLAGPDSRDRFCLDAAPADYLGELRKGIKGLRVAWSPDLGYANVDSEVARLAKEAALAFEALGCVVEETDPGFEDPTQCFLTHWQSACAGTLGPLLPQWEEKLDPGLVTATRIGLQYSAADLVVAQAKRNEHYDLVRRFFERFDLLLTPTLAVRPFQVGEICPPDRQADDLGWAHWTPFTYPFNLAPNPAATVPAGFSTDGLPVGLQIVGRRLEDLTVLQASAAYEEIHPWADARPEL